MDGGAIYYEVERLEQVLFWGEGIYTPTGPTGSRHQLGKGFLEAKGTGLEASAWAPSTRLPLGRWRSLEQAIKQSCASGFFLFFVK